MEPFFKGVRVRERDYIDGMALFIYMMFPLKAIKAIKTPLDLPTMPNKASRWHGLFKGYHSLIIDCALSDPNAVRHFL